MQDHLPGPLGDAQRRISKELAEEAARLREESAKAHDHADLTEQLKVMLGRLEDLAGELRGHGERIEQLEAKPAPKPRPSRAKPKPTTTK